MSVLVVWAGRKGIATGPLPWGAAGAAAGGHRWADDYQSIE